VSLRLAALNLFLRRAVRPLIERTGTPAAARRSLDIATRVFLHGPRIATRETLSNGVPAIEFLPPGPQGDGTILYLHGGAYVAGSPRTHRAMLSVLAATSGVRVLAPDYRLAPEHSALTAFEDASAVMGVLNPERTVLGGDSAGGGLALALLAHLLDRDERPAGLFAFSPWTDLAATGPSLVENAMRDVILPASRLDEVTEMVLQGADPEDPRISPLYADFPGAPPMLLEVGLSEILRDDTLRLAERLREQGADVTLHTLPHAPHVWQMLVGLVPEARVSLERAARFARTCLTPSSPARGS
jgi:acetyl esterase/lipase